MSAINPGDLGFPLTDSPKSALPNVVVIPTKDHAETKCVALVQELLNQGEADKILVYDNRDVTAPGILVPAFDFDERVLWSLHPGKTITEMWNHGWATAFAFGLYAPVNLAILNDDITIPPGFLGRMARTLRCQDDLWLVCPDYERALVDDDPRFEIRQFVNGTYGQGGVCGWAFMLRGELLGAPLPPVDEQFRWWYGDDDLVMQIKLHGGLCAKISGLACEHEQSATGKLYPKLMETAHEDGARFREKYYQ